MAARPTRFPVPIVKLNSENEAPGYFGDRGVSNPLYRYVEVPGTSHQPLDGNAYAHDLLTQVRGSFPSCPFPYEGPGGPVGIDPVLRASVVHLDRWIQTGHTPPIAPLIDMVASPTNPNLGVIQRDQYGNATGGIRMPQQVVPDGSEHSVVRLRSSLPARSGPIVLATFPQWDAFDGGADPAVDPTDTVNATEPASAKAVYKNHGLYVVKFLFATLGGHQLWLHPASGRRGALPGRCALGHREVALSRGDGAGPPPASGGPAHRLRADLGPRRRDRLPIRSIIRRLSGPIL